MNKTKIEWTDVTKNPIKGYCPMNCSYCYAHDFYNRFKWDKTIRFEPKVLQEIKQIKQPCKIFLCSTIELFHPTILDKWREQIFNTIEQCPQHTFQILTKLPQFIEPQRFPDNLWMGISLDGMWKTDIMDVLYFIEDKNIKASVKFLSLEPYKKQIDGSIVTGFDWVIIGGQTGKQIFVPPKGWIDYIINWCQNEVRDIPVFVKDNCHYPVVKQEYPKLQQSGLKEK